VAALAGLSAAASLLEACGSAAGPPAPSAAPTPVPTEPTRPPIAATVVVAAPTAAPAAAGAATPPNMDPNATITIAESRTSDTLDPLKHFNFQNSDTNRHLFDALLWARPDTSLEPGLAVAWENPSPTTWVFKLREGVKFHDGGEFTAEDIKVTLERLVDPKTAAPQMFVWEKDIFTKLEARDTHTLVVETARPFGPMLLNLSYLQILPAWTKDPEKAATIAAKPIGTGTGRFVSMVGDTLTLERYDGFWRTPYPHWKSLVFRFIPDPLTRLNALKAGEVDIIDRVPGEQLAQIEADPNLMIHRKVGVVNTFIGINCSKKPFDNVKVRQALNHAIDKEGIIKSILGGTATPATAPIGPAIRGVNKTLPPYTFDQAKAKDLLKEGGYADGFEMTILAVPSAAPHALEVVEASADMLSKVGIKANVRKVEAAEQSSIINGPPEAWDAYYSIWGSITGDTDIGLSRFRQGASPFKYDSPDAQKHFEGQRYNTDQKAREEAAGKMQEIVWNEAPSVFLYWEDVIYAAHKRIKEFDPSPTYQVDLRTIWAEKR
jgi:peptide/nickel transport system substrate-binding protein